MSGYSSYPPIQENTPRDLKWDEDFSEQRPQTHMVNVPASPVHRRAPSLSTFTKNGSYTTDAKDGSEDTSHDPPNGGYPPLPTKDVDARTFWQKILPESMACRAYVITVIVQTIIDLAIEGDILVRLREANDVKKEDGLDEKNPSTSKMSVYLSIFAMAHVFQLVMAVDAVYARNTLQFIFLTMFNGLFLVYAVIQRSEIREAFIHTPAVSNGLSTIPVTALTTIIPCVIAVAEIAYIGLAWSIYHEFGWKVYKFLGADRRMKEMYANYQVFDCLVKFDVFFFVGFSVQFIWLVLNKDDWEWYVTCAALPLSVLLLVEGHLAARHENKWMMATFMSGCISAMVYFVYKLVKVVIYRKTAAYELTYKSLSTFSVLAITFLVATFVFALIVLRSFGRGLKEAFDKQKNSSGDGPAKHRRGQSQNPYRMSIS